MPTCSPSFQKTCQYVLCDVKSLSHAQPFVTLWTIARQTLLAMEFSKQEYWSGLPFPSSGDLSDPGIKPGYPALYVNSLPSKPPGFYVMETPI